MNKTSDYLIAQTIAFAATLIFAVYTVVSFVASNEGKNSLKEEHDFAEGWIERYSDRRFSDAGSNISITYGYIVGGRTYFRNIITQTAFSSCDQHISDDCKLKRFWVAYSPDDPSNSLINLQDDIRLIEDRTPPKTLIEFL